MRKEGVFVGFARSANRSATAIGINMAAVVRQTNASNVSVSHLDLHIPPPFPFRTAFEELPD